MPTIDEPDAPGADPSRADSGASTQRRRGSVGRLAGATYLTTAIGFLTGPIAARSLGPEGRGAYAAVISYAGLALIVLALGMNLTVTHALLTEKRPKAMVLGLILRFCVLIFPPSVGLALLIAAFVLNDLGTVAQTWVIVFVAITPLGVLQLTFQSFLIAEGALGALARARLAPLIANAIGVVALGVAGYLTLTTYLALTLMATVYNVGQTWWLVRVRPERGEPLGPQLRFGLRAFPASLANLANARLDQLLVAPLLGARELGFYAVAVTISNVPQGLAQALGARATAQSMTSAGGVDVRTAEESLRRVIVLSLATCAGVAAATPVLVPLLYGHAFAPVTGLCLVLLVGGVALAISVVGGPILIVGGGPGANSRSELWSLAVTAAGLAVMIPALGVMGAAIVSSVAYWVRALTVLVALRQRLGVRNVWPLPNDARIVGELVLRRVLAPLRQSRRR